MPMSGRVECPDAMSPGEQRVAEIDEARAPAAPAVNEQDAWAALAPAPRPGRDAASTHGDREALGFPQPRRHPLADRAARRRAENPLRPHRGEARGGALDSPEGRSCQTQGCAHVFGSTV